MGSRIGKYELGGKLGQGGFGTIHVARDTELGRDVAIKLLRREHAFKEQVVQRFLQEARAAARITHPGIVTVFESGIAPGGDVYMAMELLAGETLAQRLKRTGRLPPGMAIELARQLASALAAAHDAGIIHRDLKPPNVFLARDPAAVGGERVKVLDFGIAKLVDDVGSSMHTHSMVMLGTPMYMSPEQCKSSAKVDARTDIYALGCMLFEMLCGTPLFDGDAGELIAKHQLVPPPTVRDVAPHVPEPLSLLVASMLAKSPNDRPPTMHAVVDTLDAIVSEPPPTLERPASTMMAGESQPVAPARRRRTLLLGAGAAIVLGVVTAVLASGHRSSPAKTIDAAQVVLVDAAPAVDADETGPRLAMECAQALTDRRWADVISCADRLAAYDAGKAKELKARAAEELKAELALAKVKEAIDSGDRAGAQAALDAIPADSVYRKEAEALLVCDADALRAKGEAAVRRGQHAGALADFEDALVCKPGDADLEALAFTAACQLASLPNARAHYTRLTAARRTSIIDICVRNGIRKDQLEPAAPAVAKASPASGCDPKELEDKGVVAEGAGQHAVALSSYELALRCKGANAPRLHKLAFLASCELHVVDKARKYWAMLSEPEHDALVQMCERAGIHRSQLEAAGCDPKALEEAAVEAEGMGQHQRALDGYEKAMTCPGAHQARDDKLAFMASCELRNKAKAKKYWSKLGPSEQAALLQMCLRAGITKDELDR